MFCGYVSTGNDPADDTGWTKDKIQSAGTAKLFLGMVTAAILCFATKRASFSARPQALCSSHCVADELPAPHTSRKPPCRHR